MHNINEPYQKSDKGDSDPKAYYIGLVGGAIGGFLGSTTTLLLGAYLPVFIYQMGLDVPPDTLGFGKSKGEQGITRFLTVFLTSLVPSFCGLIIGWIILSLVY